MKELISDKGDSFAALIGIDWADKKHDVCEFNCGSGERNLSVIAHTPESIEKWAMSLRKRYPDKKVAVSCELKRGPLINALQRFDHIVIFPINPSKVSNYRKAFAPSGSKSDPVDAALQMEILQLHRDTLKPLKPVSSLIKQLTQLVEFRRRIVQERVDVTNRLTDILKQYYPQPLDWFGEKDSLIFCDFLLKWTDLQQLKRARKQTVLDFLCAHHSRYPGINEGRVLEIKAALPLTTDPSIVLPNRLKVQVIVPQLQHLNHAIDTLDKQIKVLYQQHKDHFIYDSLPGAGPCFAPRLLVAMGDDRERYHSAAEIQKYAGIAPVIEASGKQSWTHWRYFCPKFLRQTFVEWAGQTIRYSYWAKAYYAQQMSRGKQHNAAIRSLAFKWIRILFKLWKDGKAYDESTYLNALKRQGSPLLKNAAEAP
jgi:transposase